MSIKLHAQIVGVEQYINASSVLLDEELKFEVKDLDDASFQIRKKICVLNEKDLDKFIFVEQSDRFHKIQNISISLFDAKGTEVIKNYSLKDIHIQSAGSGMVNDGKAYFFEIPHGPLPVIFEISYIIQYHGILNYPSFHFSEPDVAVKHATFSVSVPEKLDIFYKSYHTTILPTRLINNKTKQYTWELNNIPASKQELGAPSFMQTSARVDISPSRFSLDDHEGEMNSWENFGKWYHHLSEDQRKVPDVLKTELMILCQGITNEKDKIKKVYTYLQDNYRYVLITLGLGGFKPFSAELTYKNKYGDCKALSNFMQACLHEIGIKSYQCLINAGYDNLPVDTTFPHNGFNHVILCVPFQKDSVWLECTSNQNKAGELGTFTENRFALLISEQGGKIVKTPQSRSSANLFQSHTLIDLHKDGSAHSVTSIIAQGDFKNELVHFVFDNDEKVQRAYLLNRLHLIPPDVYEVKTVHEDDKLNIQFDLAYDKLPSIFFYDKMFMQTSLFSVAGFHMPLSSNREQDFYFEYPFIAHDTSIYTLPEGFVLDDKSISEHHSGKYFAYDDSTSFDPEKRTLTFISTFELKSHIIKHSDYESALQSYNLIEERRNRKVMIRKG